MKKNLISILLLIAFTSVVVFLIFHPVIQNPNNYLFSHGGDAVKSYFNFSYYLKYDSGIKYNAINYPYGEHLQYINSHPFHSAVCKITNKFFPIANGVAILNMSMIISLILAVPFLFLILRHYKLPVWYSCIITLIIIFLSPQLDRIKGDFEMVYVFFIPMFWYLLIQFRKNKKPWLWGSLLVISGLMGGFTSAYYAAFYAIFLFSVILADLWDNRLQIKKYIKPGLTLLVMAVIPILFVKGLVSITDWAPDRPNNPWGFYVYHATPFSIFLPNSNTLRELINPIINIKYQWEGRAYVGLPGTLMALSIIFAFFHKLITKKKNISLYIDNSLNTYLIGAILVLLFSMCFPFKWGFGFLLDLIPPLKQFRALGRFSWIFYYVFMVFTAYFFFQLHLKMKAKGFVKFPILFLSFVLIFWSVDAGVNAQKSFRAIFHENNILETSDAKHQEILEKANINIEDYQAIFFLPFANTSGDKLFFERGLNAFAEAMSWSYHTGLPLVQSFSPRLPFSNALSCVQMLADSSIRKTRLDDMNDQPLLLVYSNETLTNAEKWLKDRSQILWTNDNVTLAEFQLDVYDTSYKNWLKYTEEISPTLKGNDSIKADVPLSKIYYQNFEDKNSEYVFHGNGAQFKRRKSVELFNENFYQQGKSGQYKLTYWMFFDTRIANMPQAKLFLFDKDGNRLKTFRINNRAIHNVYNNWVRVEHDFVIEEDIQYKLEVKGKYITIDDLLLQPKGSNVLTIAIDGKEMFNNFPL